MKTVLRALTMAPSFLLAGHEPHRGGLLQGEESHQEGEGEDARSAICGHRRSARSGQRAGRTWLLRSLRLRDVLGPLIMKTALGCRLTPEPGGPSPDYDSPPYGYELAYSIPRANPYHHLPEEAPRLHPPVHIPMHIAPERRALPPLQVRVAHNQDRS